MRLKKPTLCASVKRIGRSSPKKRATKSSYDSATSVPLRWMAGRPWLEACSTASDSGVTQDVLDVAQREHVALIDAVGVVARDQQVFDHGRAAVNGALGFGAEHAQNAV